MIADVNELSWLVQTMNRGETSYFGLLGTLCSLLGERTDCDRCRPALKDSVLNDFFTLVDLLAPYREEKLSDGRWWRENMIQVFQVSLCDVKMIG